MPQPATAKKAARTEASVHARHERNPHLVILLFANGVLLFSALLTHNRIIFPLALLVCIVLTLGYLYTWNRAGKY